MTRRFSIPEQFRIREAQAAFGIPYTGTPETRIAWMIYNALTIYEPLEESPCLALSA